MINKLKPKSEFTRNVLTLMTGTTIAQAIPIAISPILTRLYTPEEFGVLALLVAIVSIFGSIAAGRYELAIMLPKKDEDAINIVALGIIITSIFSFIIFLVILFFNSQIVNLLNNKEISPWLYFVPLVVFLIGIYNILNYWNNRKKYYKDLAKATVIKSIAGSITQLSLGFFKAGVTGLISGYIISQIFANGKLFINFKKEQKKINIKKNKILLIMKKYSKFPLYSVPTIIINTSYRQIIVMFISIHFGNNFLGFFYMTQNILAVPLSLISMAVGKVFFQHLAYYYQIQKSPYLLFKQTFKKLLVIDILIFIIIVLISGYVNIIFGDSWKNISDYLIILLPLYSINFITSPLDEIFNIYNKQYILLIFNLFLLLNSILLCYLTIKLDFSFDNFLKIYTTLFSLMYLVIFIISFYFSKHTGVE